MLNQQVNTHDLTVNTGATLTIAYNGGLTTHGDFNNNGHFIIQSEGGSGYSGSYIDNGGISGTGTFEFDRIVLCSGTHPQPVVRWAGIILHAPFDGFTTDNIPDYFVNAWNQPQGMWWQYFKDMVFNPCGTFVQQLL